MYSYIVVTPSQKKTLYIHVYAHPNTHILFIFMRGPLMARAFMKTHVKRYEDTYIEA